MGKNNHKIAIIGLGYVGLPLAVEFAKNTLLLGLTPTCTESLN